MVDYWAKKMFSTRVGFRNGQIATKGVTLRSQPAPEAPGAPDGGNKQMSP